MKRLLKKHGLERVMTVKDFELKAIDAERYTERKEKRKNIKINHNSSVTKVNKIDSKTNQVDFRFTANYSGMGVIKIEGSLKFIGEFPNLAKNWRKKNKMPNEVAKEIHTTVINNCIPQSVTIARDLNLPPPIPLPKVNMPDEGSNKTSSKGGMEVA
ncbi:MAG: hypothetical protein KGY66_04080 [Candidatus Thermoplasmatota archaeon]|nr:hypothetical protein [Candidatus Thermoplasmatota archaeon]MBS3790076.1 hypothetical protein [Candidatus Thermoplasmatota archaeon]